MTDPSDVESVLRAAFTGDVDAPAMFRSLSAATLLLAVRPGADGPEPYVFTYIDRPHGAVFTSRELTSALPDAPDYLEVAGAELGRRWPDGLFAVLNPGGGQLARAFDDAAMRLLATPDAVPDGQSGGTAMAPSALGPSGQVGGSPAPRRAEPELRAGEVYAVGAPAQDPPTELVDALREAVRGTPGAERGYLFQFVQPPSPPRYVAGVVAAGDADTADRTTLAVADATAAAFPPAAQLDFLALDETMAGQVAEHVPTVD